MNEVVAIFEAKFSALLQPKLCLFYHIVMSEYIDLLKFVDIPNAADAFDQSSKQRD